MNSSNILPSKLFSCKQSRELDRQTASFESIAIIVLMKRAGLAAYQSIIERYGNAPLFIVCGAGNNAGDGYVIAALAAQKQHPVSVAFLKDPQLLSGDAAQAAAYAAQENVLIRAFDPVLLQNCEAQTIVVDALLGTGFTSPLREEYRAAINAVNQSGKRVFSLDIPSGLNGDTGHGDEIVYADACMTFIALKPGLLTANGPDCVGDLYYSGLGAPAKVFDDQQAVALRIDYQACDKLKPRRRKTAHKGTHGKVLVCGGGESMGGAAIMAAEAALLSGAGLVHLATHEDHVSASLVRAPEILVSAVSSYPELAALTRAEALIVGPGMGQSAWSEQLLLAALEATCPLVVDADALNLLAKRGLSHFGTKRENWVLTPHPGEAARLLNSSIAEIQKDRIGAAKSLQQTFGGIVVLKGAGTVIATSCETYIANVGNPGLAVAGMGDILAGIIGALLAQGLDPESAAKLAVCVHGAAADVARQDNGGEIGMRATQLLPLIRGLINK